MYLLIIFLPLIAFLFTILLGRYIGLGSFFIISTSTGITLFLVIIGFYEIVYTNSKIYIDLAKFIQFQNIDIDFKFIFDSITISMLLIISLISFLVNIFSIYYMSHEKHYPRFMGYLSLFTFFMILLVTSNNLLLLFIGWEGVGLVSYFLINFWFTRILANKAALKAFIYNKFGDIFLLIGILGLTINCGSIDLEIIFSVISESKIIELLTLSIFIGVMSKSAQIG